MHIIEDIKWTAAKFSSICWNHIFKDANFIVDAFAREGLLISGCHFWDHCTSFVLNDIRFDSIRNGCNPDFSSSRLIKYKRCHMSTFSVMTNLLI